MGPWRGGTTLLTTNRAVPFAVATALALPMTFLPPDTPAVGLLAFASALSIVVLGLAALAPWRRLPEWAEVAPALLYLGVVALLRHAEGGASSGYSPLVMVPLFWTALYGNRAQLATVCSAIVVMFASPILLVGGADYPTTEWRRLAIWTTVGPVVGVTVQNLLDTIARKNRELEALARTDALTGTANRRAWDERVELELARAGRLGQSLAVALLDLDHFKRFNDTHGHQAGDELLVSTAARFQTQLRATDLLARWGGEEFAILLPDTTPDRAAEVVERVRTAASEGQTVSAGLAVWNGSESFDATLRRADSYLYEAKSQGRDRLVARDATERTGTGAPSQVTGAPVIKRFAMSRRWSRSKGFTR